MRKYQHIAQIQFKAQIIYRFDVAMTVVESIGMVLFAWLIWGAIFQTREEVTGFTFGTMLLYYILASFINSLDLSEGISREVSSGIRGGTFSKFLVIPSHPFLHFLAANFGKMGYYLLFIIPTTMLSYLLFGGGLEIGRMSSILLGVTMIFLGLLFMSTYHYFIGLMAFKFQDIGLFLHVQGTVIFFSQGGMLPLTLLPEGVLQVIRFLPFPHVVFTPIMLLMGQLDVREGLLSLVILLGWQVLMTLIVGRTYKRLRIKYDGVGI